MNQTEKDQGTINALILRMDEYGIPRARYLLEKVNGGEILSDRDINFLKRVYRDNQINRSLIKRDPEFQKIMARFIDLYTEICTRALENEKARVNIH
jgi:hypothetical protein